MKVQGKAEPVHTLWVQQFYDIFGKKGDAWHMIVGDNPAGHGFVLRDLVLIELSGPCTPPPPPPHQLGRGGLKISEVRSGEGIRNFNFGERGVYCLGDT